MQISNIDFSQLTVDQVCELINNVLSGNNQKIAQATKLLKAYTKHKTSIRNLTNILVNSNNIGHRQMSAVLLKRNIVNLYIPLAEEEKTQFRAVLLNQYIRQTSIAVQKGIATLIGILLSVVELKNWVQLQRLLDQAVQSAPNSVATFVLLNCLLNHFKAPKQLYMYLFNALKVPHLLDEALKCIIAVAETQDVDQSLAVQLIKLWQSSGWGEDVSLNCLQVLNILAERKIKLNDQIIDWICQHIISNKKLSTRFRVAGLDFLSTYVEFNGKTLEKKEKLLKKIVETVCNVCSEPFGHQNAEEGDGDVQEISLWFIQTLSITLKTKKIYPILLDVVTKLINANDIYQMNTGFLLLGSMAEGCSDRLKKNLQNPVMNVLIPKGLSHPAPQVRGAAINALSYFSEFLIPDIVHYHGTIIPQMMKYINDMSSKVAEKALIAIDVFFDNMEEQQIKQYLPVVIPTLAQVIRGQNSTPIMRNASMSGIGTAIQVSKQTFESYVQSVYSMCIQILKIGASPQNNAVRAQNIEVLGKICNIFCGKEYQHRQQFFKTYAIPIMEPVYFMLTQQTDPQIRQSCFTFFYLTANAIQTNFSIIFDKIIVEVLKSATLKVKQKKKKNEFSLDSDSQDENNYLTEVQVAEYDEKAAAIKALGQFANACPTNFTPYFQQAYKILDDHHQFFYDSVRIQVAICYVNLLKGQIKSLNNGVLPTYQCGLPVLQRYPADIQRFIANQIIGKLLFIISEDDSNRVISQSIQSLYQLVHTFGPATVDHSIEKITQSIIQLLESQQAEEDDDEQGQQQGEDDQDVDAYIFEPLCGQLIPTLAEVLKGGFLPSLSQIYPYMSKFLEQRENINDNVQMTGCISQLIKHVPSFFDNYADQLFQNLSTLTKLEDTDLNRNIAYCLAEAIQKSPQSMKKYLEHALFILKNIYDHKNSHQACKDNALAGICRAIIVFDPPMPYEVFLSTLVQSMPFKGDEEQEGVAIRCIIHLSHKNAALVQPYIQSLVSIIQNDVSNPKKYKLEGELLEQAINFLKLLKGSQ